MLRPKMVPTEILLHRSAANWITCSPVSVSGNRRSAALRWPRQASQARSGCQCRTTCRCWR